MELTIFVKTPERIWLYTKIYQKHDTNKNKQNKNKQTKTLLWIDWWWLEIIKQLVVEILWQKLHIGESSWWFETFQFIKWSLGCLDNTTRSTTLYVARWWIVCEPIDLMIIWFVIWSNESRWSFNCSQYFWQITSLRIWQKSTFNIDPVCAWQTSVDCWLANGHSILGGFILGAIKPIVALISKIRFFKSPSIINSNDWTFMKVRLNNINNCHSVRDKAPK